MASSASSTRPAAAILGYAEPAELTGRQSHETIHYLRADGSPFPVDECPMLRVRVTGKTLHTEEDWFVRKDGSLVPVAYSSAPFRGDGWGAVITFRDITERLRLEESTRREAIERAHAEDVQTSRRRIAAASDAARKQIERDIHDGAQQQLIAVSLRLEEARAAARDDPRVGGGGHRNRAERAPRGPPGASRTRAGNSSGCTDRARAGRRPPRGRPAERDSE